MPKLSDSMEEGTILTWLKADGETVAAGEDLVEIETDKATVTHPADAAGVLSIVAPEGTSLPVGATIARVGEASEGAPPTPRESAPRSSGAEIPAGANGNGVVSPATVKATPLARRIAARHDVALDDVAGSGPLGRVTRADVLQRAGVDDPLTLPSARPATAAPAVAPPPSSPAAAPAPGGAKGDVEVVEPTRLQAVVARRMAEAKATIPHFQVQTDVAMDAAIAFRAQLKATGADAPSFNDLVVKAAALALRAHPLANGSYRDGRFEQYARINVGIAVAADGALVVPTIFDADEKSLGAIAAEARRLAGRVREGTVSPPELAGATFTVSNLGMYGMTAITPVINAPQAAILGVGAMREVLARVDGEIVDRQLMTLTLSCDHRILYGAEAAQFLSDLRALLEQPLRLAL
ncbi:Dihydrolipoyllysine-residue acetyltransferase component of pyruvate dehydrogenase complex [Baekduia alba]|nr:Dihydrolipoyllysine-residue acetyltransferase component of pyruvate dehydrogenase complex [Baekduia alba]